MKKRINKLIFLLIGFMMIFSVLGCFIEDFYDNFDMENIPGKVTNLKAETGNRQVTIIWTQPEKNSSYVSGYYVMIKGEPITLQLVNSDIPPFTYTFTGLTNGKKYTFEVWAKGAFLSDGDGSKKSISATPN